MITLTQLILVLCLVESSLDPNAIGDGGDAVGILQIHECVIQDVNRIYKTDYNLNDRYDPMLSKMICRKYLSHWGKVYTKRTGKEPTAEILAKIWNGGALAYEKTNPKVVERLDAYWGKVHKLL
tara:strand:- start:25 stop:396 length:372 start_codon:yes stop_codon:yes gene_type:complete